MYGRRADWKQVLESARPYLEACVGNPGSIKLHLTDPRGVDAQGRVYNSPYQYAFQQMHKDNSMDVSYKHLRAHETVLELGCRLLLEKKKKKKEFRCLICAHYRCKPPSVKG